MWMRFKWFCSDKWLGAVTRDGLFAKKTENIFVTASFIIFAAFTVPSMSSFPSLGTLAIVVLCLVIYTLLWFWNVDGDEQDRRWLLPMFAAAFSSIFLFGFISSPVFLPDKLGSIIILSLSLSISVVVASTIYDWGKERKFPALTFLIILALFSSYLNLNDNHQFRQTFVEDVPELKSVDNQFGEWLSYRPDLEQYQKADKPYPVYIVSAQGGGIFAAYHTAMTLSRLQDLYPQFAQHILAISSVSGGSLGATIFSSLVNEYVDSSQPHSYCQKERKSCLEYKAKQILDRDFLSPLLAAGLFPDFVQRFIPFKIRQWDRARSLEYSLEESWKATQSDNNPFQQSYYQAWNPQRIAPALVINTTVEETGERILLSPFKISRTDRNIRFYRQNIDFNLSTAAVLSARFPLITPLGWFKGDDGKRYRLADGGYFDNSGVTSAVEIDSSLSNYLSQFQQSEFKKKFGVTPKLIHLSIVNKFEQANSKDNQDKGLNEIASPIRTVFNVREARGKSVIREADERYNQEKTDYIFEMANNLSSTKTYDPFQDKFRKFLLDKDTEQGKLPLGWLLSDSSQKLIDNQSGMPDRCNQDEFLKDVARGEAQEDYNVKNHNSCISKSVIDELNS